MVEFHVDVYKMASVRSTSIVLCSTYDAGYQEINKIHEICTPLYSALIEEIKISKWKATTRFQHSDPSINKLYLFYLNKPQTH
jgi:hypothetical protein